MNNQNLFSLGDTPVAPTLTREQMALVLLQDAVSDLTDSRRTITDLERSNAELRRENFDLWLTAIGRDQLAAKCERLAAERDQAVARSDQLAASNEQLTASNEQLTAERDQLAVDRNQLEAVIQRSNADHMQTAIELQRSEALRMQIIDGYEREAEVHRYNANVLQGTVAGQQSQLNEAQCVSVICLAAIYYFMNRHAEFESRTEIRRQSLDADDPPPDILTDDDNSDVVDIVVEIPTVADPIATTPDTSLVVATPVVDPLPSFDLADSTPQEPLGAMYDQYGAEVTPERLLAAIKPFVIIDLDLLLAIYRSMYGYRLLSSGVSPLDFIQACTRRGTLRRWTPLPTGTHSARLIDINLLCCSELEFGTLRQNIRRRLGLADDITAPILSPVLCFTLVTLCGIRMDRMTGQILDQAFTTVTDITLRSIWVTMESGPKQISEDNLCQMVKAWVEGLAELIAMDSDIDQSLDRARICNAEYTRRCVADRSNPMANIATDMLRTGEFFSQFLLGIRVDDLRELSKVLVHVVDSGTSPQIKDILRRVAGELQHQPCSP
ncbi:hypothetical protein H4S07_000435 [Coemansia furcata]|uniref:Uncharacterized protein n=1 Tax=Coemansia furcata TaxID=417177 RepID=A0ACC1LS48_9FUNG|nr:hypothetical protein H4S07_000435 [Coemansia furcata]